ncbi:hypothetical protein [Mycobacterium sp.]|uniref:hypothetical protein n=1 Tax=Mycobacterium sp. TaxID=1785 RepID=UPI0026147168|nr:hypothetical protein [Mycobacterium sp.]
MTTIPVTAAVIRDRADALHAAIDARDTHRDNCTKAWCAYCTSLERTAHDAYQSAMDAAAVVNRGGAQ